MSAVASRHHHPRSHLQEARTWDDDWTGLADAAERRRRQNRLHQRAWRRRKVQHQTTTADAEYRDANPHGHGCPASGPPAASTGADLTTLQREVAVLLKARSHVIPHAQLYPFSYWERLKAERQGNRPPEDSELTIDTSSNSTRLIPPMIPYLPPFTTDESVREGKYPLIEFNFPLSIDHQLIVLVQFNALRAMLTNLSILSLQHRMPSECGGIFNIACLPESPSTIPQSLQPTELQQAIPHDFWIDMIPFPAMRDNLLLNPDIDEHEICDDSLGGLYEGFDDIQTRGMIVWGEPWSPSGWEVSEGFARKWGFLLRGCTELMDATQRYREARGEERLVFEI